jgi:hypothetical protein
LFTGIAAESRCEAGEEHSPSIESESYIHRGLTLRLCCDFHRGDELCHNQGKKQQASEEANRRKIRSTEEKFVNQTHRGEAAG